MKLGIRSSTVAALSLLVTAVTQAQTYTKLAPLPTGADLAGVCFTTPDIGWVAGDNHTLLMTTDGSASWTALATPGFASEPFYDVNFASATNGFVAGNASNDVYRSTNGGTIWQSIPGFPLGGSWYHVQFVNATTGFMGSNGGLVRSTDSGASWSVRSGYPSCPVIYGMDFVDANVGLVSGELISTNESGIFKTTDGGATWTFRHAGLVNHAVYLTPTLAVACDATTILQSNDAGDTWEPTGGDVPSGLFSLAKIDSTTVVGVSAGGDIWRSNDSGATWSLRMIGIGDLPKRWRVKFFDGLIGHVVGPGGAIRRTEDGGNTWTVVNKGASVEWRGMVAFSDAEVLMAGVHGYVQTTSDAGQHWDTQLIDPPYFGHDSLFTDVAITSPNEAYVVGYEGGMYKTFDRGTTWQNLSFSVNPSYFPNAVDFTDANNGWVVGFDYNTGPKTYVRRTFDGGFSWQPANLNVPSIDVQFVDQTGYVLTTSQPLYKTIDGGTTWTPLMISTPSGGPTSNWSMRWSSSTVGYIAGFDGFLARTSNGGSSWTRIRPAQSSFVYLGVNAAGPNEVWACGASQGGGNAVVIRSMNAGATWTTWSLPGQYADPVCIALTAQYAYVAGYAGEVWRFDRVLPLATIAASNPPATSPYQPGQPFRDVLQTGTSSALSQGIGAAGTPAEDAVQYAQISVTFSSAPVPAPDPANITVQCTDIAANGQTDCPTVTAVTGTGAYLLTLSGAIPPRECTTFTFAGTSTGQKLQYQWLPGDTNLDGLTNTQDLLFLVQNVNSDSANQPVNWARYNIDRSTQVSNRVNTQDLLREVQLLNGVNTTQAFNGATVAPCP